MAPAKLPPDTTEFTLAMAFDKQYRKSLLFENAKGSIFVERKNLNVFSTLKNFISSIVTLIYREII